MMLPEFKTILMLDGWTMDESIDSIMWNREGVTLQWDRGATTGFLQMVFHSQKIPPKRSSKNRANRLSAYTSFQECIDDFE